MQYSGSSRLGYMGNIDRWMVLMCGAVRWDSGGRVGQMEWVKYSFIVEID